MNHGLTGAAITDTTTHRGLTWKDMPGPTLQQKRLTFVLFKRDKWPPVQWHIPDAAEGPELKSRIEERLAICGKGKRKSRD